MKNRSWTRLYGILICHMLEEKLSGNLDKFKEWIIKN